jgi:hypothetical protein
MNGVRAIGAIIRMMTNQHTNNTHDNNITREESTHVTTVLGTTVRALTDETENG